ncbi:hypothetical protein C8Q74DRAFT_1222763 [Fomes fomentarius]|nr:hypothetical protein C8Q74DRAFT_1222763 [Fomes fomentarius]
MTDRDDSHLVLSYALHPGDVSDAPNNAVNPANNVVRHMLAPMLEHKHAHQPLCVTHYANTPAPTPDVAVLNVRAATLNWDYLCTTGHADYDPNPYDLTMNLYDMARFYAAFGPSLRNDTVPLPVAPDGHVFYVPIHHVIHHFAPSGQLLIDRPTDTSPDAGRDDSAPVVQIIPLSLSR